VSFVAAGGKDIRRKRVATMPPLSARSALARGRWRGGLVALVLRSGLAAVVLGAVGCFVAYAAPLFVVEPSSGGAGEARAAPLSPATASRCWTNHTSATLFLGPWFAPLAPTERLQGDCSMGSDPSPPRPVGGASPPYASSPYRVSSPSEPLTTSVAAGLPSPSELRSPKPAPAEPGRVAAEHPQAPPREAPSNVTEEQYRYPDAPSQTDAKARRSEPTTASPNQSHPDRTRDRTRSSPLVETVIERVVAAITGHRAERAIPLGGVSSSDPSAIDVGGQKHDERSTHGSSGHQW
jgi:hypothetical protein